MSEHEEIEEHIHHAHEPFDKTVAGTMAIIAATLAIVSVLGQHFNTEELLNQQKSSDQWAFYQAKKIRGYSAQEARDILLQLKTGSDLAGSYGKDTAKEAKDAEAIQDKAKEYETESALAGRRSIRFHLGEVFLEIAIVLSSLAILTKQRLLFMGGAIGAAIGVVTAVTAYWA
jgi:hypothetical protein